MNQTKQRIEYVPPKSVAIRAFARRVCEVLADRMKDPCYLDPDVIRGFAMFLEIGARAKARHLNNQQCVDRAEK